MSVPLVVYAFTQVYNGTKRVLHCLRRKAGSQDVCTEDDVAKEVEEASSLSKGDVTHVLGIFMTEMRKILVRGDRVKITGLGTFYMTVTSGAKDNPDDLTVRDIRRVNIRFLPDKALKLVNNALATTRSDNNVVFAIKGKEEIASGDNAGETVDTANTGEEDDDVEIPAGDGGSIDPNA